MSHVSAVIVSLFILALPAVSWVEQQTLARWQSRLAYSMVDSSPIVQCRHDVVVMGSATAGYAVLPIAPNSRACRYTAWP